jgi:hypothetical protein
LSGFGPGNYRSKFRKRKVIPLEVTELEFFQTAPPGRGNGGIRQNLKNFWVQVAEVSVSHRYFK